MDPSQKPHKTYSKKAIIITVCISGALLIVVIAVLLMWLLFTQLSTQKTEKAQSQAETQNSRLMIGAKPYLYPCTVASRDDFARIFELDGDGSGTIAERSALAPKYVTGGNDLLKLAPSAYSIASYRSSCSYTLSKKDAVRVNTISVDVTQFEKDKDALSLFESNRSLESTSSKAEPPALPSFGASRSFIDVPAADDDFKLLKATFVYESKVVRFDYSYRAPETYDNVITKIDAYAKAIEGNLKKSDPAKESKDWTGQSTFVGSKLVDICQRTDPKKVGASLGGLTFSPEDMQTSYTYASLAGSRAAEDGAVVSCTLKFNTPADRDAQEAAQADKSYPLSGSQKWPHTIAYGTNTFKDAAAAEAAFANNRQRSKDGGGNTNQNRVEDVSGAGDRAYIIHRETTQASLGTSQIEDTLIVQQGKEVVSIALRQLSGNSSDYTYGPVPLTSEQLTQTYALIAAVLSDGKRT